MTTATAAPGLHLGDGLTFPLDAVTRRLAILAMSGAGKSNVAVVLAEAMFDTGLPWVAIDPKGDWWGVRSNKTGKGPGLPIPIFGGLHGDLPLAHTAGALIANVIIEKRLTCVLDVSEFDTRQQMWAFLADFGETILAKNRQAIHLFLEECDEYLPQRTTEKGNLPRCLGIWQRVVKRGRFRGIGSTQITQRNASLNKDTLYMAEALIAMRVTGEGDRKAVKGWVEHHNAAKEIVASLPTLKDGEGWISSPAWLRETKRVQFPRRRTFDSGATPVMLTGSAPPATLADVDLDELRALLEPPKPEKKAIHPKVKAMAQAWTATVPTRQEEPTVTKDEADRLERANANLRADNLALRNELDELKQLVQRNIIVHDNPTGPAQSKSQEKRPERPADPPVRSTTPLAAFAGDDESRYQAFKGRLLSEASTDPVLLRVLLSKPELEIAVTRKTIEANGDELSGRCGRLMAEGWFNAAKGATATSTEMARRGWMHDYRNIAKVLDRYTEDGFFTREGGGYVIVPGMKINIIER